MTTYFLGIFSTRILILWTFYKIYDQSKRVTVCINRLKSILILAQKMSNLFNLQYCHELPLKMWFFYMTVKTHILFYIYEEWRRSYKKFHNRKKALTPGQPVKWRHCLPAVFLIFIHAFHFFMEELRFFKIIYRIESLCSTRVQSSSLTYLL